MARLETHWLTQPGRLRAQAQAGSGKRSFLTFWNDGSISLVLVPYTVTVTQAGSCQCRLAARAGRRAGPGPAADNAGHWQLELEP